MHGDFSNKLHYFMLPFCKRITISIDSDNKKKCVSACVIFELVSSRFVQKTLRVLQIDSCLNISIDIQEIGLRNFDTSLKCTLQIYIKSLNTCFVCVIILSLKCLLSAFRSNFGAIQRLEITENGYQQCCAQVRHVYLICYNNTDVIYSSS